VVDVLLENIHIHDQFAAITSEVESAANGFDSKQLSQMNKTGSILSWFSIEYYLGIGSWAWISALTRAIHIIGYQIRCATGGAQDLAPAFSLAYFRWTRTINLLSTFKFSLEMHALRGFVSLDLRAIYFAERFIVWFANIKVFLFSHHFDRVPASTPGAAPALTPSITTLKSGLTIITEPSALTSTVSLTYPSAGSSNELPSESGAAIANRYLAFKSGKELSTALITRSIEDVGATMFASAGRRGATVGYTALKENAAWISPLLAVQSGFEKWDVRDAVKLAGKEVEEAKANAQVSSMKMNNSRAFSEECEYWSGL
jgi:hypothetical protein